MLVRWMVLLLLTMVAAESVAQTVFTGIVSDKKSGAVLPAANIQIVDTYRGTISNFDGKYRLEITTLPATIMVNYIGYRTQLIQVTEQTNTRLDFLLEPTALAFQELVVTAEDPAIGIMKKVIEKKKVWRQQIETYTAEAYTRQVLENDTAIVVIREILSVAFWDRDRGPREVMKSTRQTANLSEIHDVAVAATIPNFYDDDIEVEGFNMIGPTHPDALDYYDFRLTGFRSFDGRKVYDIEVIPKSRLQPVFSGRLAVLDEEYAMLEVMLKPSEDLVYPPPIQAWQIDYSQQFRNFGKAFWLPVDVRASGRILIGMIGLQFPPIVYSQLTRLNNYQVNVPLPDSLYEDSKILHVDSLSLKRKDLFENNTEVIPLSERETAAYDSVDSSMTMIKAFKPTGFLARFVKVSDGSDQEKDGKTGSKVSDGLGPRLWFNRVDGLHAGIRKETKFGKWLTTEFGVGYSVGVGRWTFVGKGGFVWGKENAGSVRVEYGRGTEHYYGPTHYPMFLTSVPVLFAEPDYLDYFWNEKIRAGVTHGIDWHDVQFSVLVSHEKHESVKKHTDFDLLSRSVVQRENPGIEEGTLRSITLKAALGDEHVPYGFVGQNGLTLEVEKSSTGFLHGDFSFTRAAFSMDLHVNTFLKRRLMPNALDMRVVGGTASGHLPVQRFGMLDTRLLGFTPFGGFRSIGDRALLGEKYFGVFWEHNFRTVPLELIGLRGLARKGIGLILLGASGRTWIDRDRRAIPGYNPGFVNHMIHELGISVNGLFGLLRIDYARRLDRSGYFLGLSLARWF